MIRSPSEDVGFVGFHKDGWMELVRPAEAFAASCRADPRFDRDELFLSAFTFAADFVDHFVAHGRKGWAGACGTGKLHWDADGRGALDGARRIASYLLERYEDEGAILAGLSGSKGYHVELAIPPVPPAPGVAAAVCRLCRAVAAATNTAVDLGVYDPTRLWRCWNSRHEATGLYKRRLTLEELLHLTGDAHAELARSRMGFEPPTPATSPRLAEDWALSLSVATGCVPTAIPRASPTGVAPLTEAAFEFLAGRTPEGGRHRACVHAAASLARAGCPEPLAFDLLLRAAAACGLSADYARSDVLRAVKNGWDLGIAEKETGDEGLG